MRWRAILIELAACAVTYWLWWWLLTSVWLGPVTVVSVTLYGLVFFCFWLFGWTLGRCVFEAISPGSTKRP